MTNDQAKKTKENKNKQKPVMSWSHSSYTGLFFKATIELCNYVYFETKLEKWYMKVASFK